MLDRLKSLFADRQLTEDQVTAALTRIVNCRLLGWVVRLTGTEIDDRVLTTLRELFPKR